MCGQQPWDVMADGMAGRAMEPAALRDKRASIFTFSNKSSHVYWICL